MDASPRQQACDWLLGYLRSLRARGCSHVAVDPAVLQRFTQRNQASVTEVRGPAAATSAAARAREPAAESKGQSLRASPPIELQGQSLEQRMHGLLDHLAARLPSIAPWRHALRAPGLGPMDASLCLITDTWLAEDPQGVAQGAEGDKLAKILGAMGSGLSQVYLTALLKDPSLRSQSRSLEPAELDLYVSVLCTEIAQLRPRLLVVMGQQACAALGLGQATQALRGRVHQVLGIPVVVTHPPMHLIRQEQTADGGLRAKRECWEDMLQVMELMGMPISEKQRGYFRR